MITPKTIDPVCGMAVSEDCPFTAEVEGLVLRFCSEGCRHKFLAEKAAGSKRLAYDLLIVGAGPAGLTAAVYAATLGDDALILSRDLGGQAVDSTKIENYMGYDFISGPELIERFRDQLIHSHHLDHRMVEVGSVEACQDGFRVTTSDGIAYEAKALIVATGMNPRRLSTPGEQEFLRRGVFYGHAGDFAFMEGRRVAVIGGGNSALQLVENLEPLASRTYLVSHSSLTGDQAVVERVLQSGKLERFEQHEVVAFTGSNKLEAIRIRKRGTTEETELAVDGAFIAIGFRPASALVASLVDLNRRGEIQIRPDCSTSRPGIFAAGDVTDAFGKRIIIASGEGAKAAMAVHTYLGRKSGHDTRQVLSCGEA
ncbi:FAD-dependent oxidoreductase [candidate division WOR-3 bacterium]|nr:FAD-dependent oxidoreductase [candidate division WOR-3 bacterium]